MSANTTIEWATKSWNPVRGCSRVSPGCDNCYAMNFAHRFSGAGKPYEGLTTIRKGKVDWTGSARLISGALGEPIRWRRAERVFVNSMSDLFHSSLSDGQIDSVFGVMWSCLYTGRRDAVVPGHEFLILTKRAERMREYFATDRRESWARAAVHAGGGIDPDGIYDQTYFHKGPHPRIWLGVSVENQVAADERVRLLLECPAAIHWVSAEPLLGPVDFEHVNSLAGAWNALRPSITPATIDNPRRVDWVVIGGESGPGARPFNVEWARSLVEQCRAAGVAPFVKQFGSKPSASRSDVLATRDPNTWLKLKDRKGGDLSEIPGNWPREFPTPRTGAAAE